MLTLPDDILFSITPFLDIKNIIHLIYTNKKLKIKLYKNSAWSHLIKNNTNNKIDYRLIIKNSILHKKYLKKQLSNKILYISSNIIIYNYMIKKKENINNLHNFMIILNELVSKKLLTGDIYRETIKYYQL
jgi:hypothetical protein